MKRMNLLLTIVIIATIFAGCKKDDPVDDFLKDASISNGGIMYDKFWSEESDFDQTNDQLETLGASSNFFRCKQCHGWDGLGNSGAYISRAPKTSRPNVASIKLFEYVKTKTAQELFDAIKETSNKRSISYDLASYDPDTNKTEGDKMPDLSQLLSDSQIRDLIKFLKEGMFDVSQLYDATYAGSYPTGSMTISNVGKDGNAISGNGYYTGRCSSCHGADGTNIDREGKTLGKFVRTKANEVQHKIRYGQLGSLMTGIFDITLEEIKNIYKACSDTEAFPD